MFWCFIAGLILLDLWGTSITQETVMLPQLCVFVSIWPHCIGTNVLTVVETRVAGLSYIVPFANGRWGSVSRPGPFKRSVKRRGNKLETAIIFHGVFRCPSVSAIMVFIRNYFRGLLVEILRLFITYHPYFWMPSFLISTSKNPQINEVYIELLDSLRTGDHVLTLETAHSWMVHSSFPWILDILLI